MSLTKLTPDSDAVTGVAEMLYGDGAWEIISKMTDRTQRRVTAGLSAIGGTAGAAGLGYAGLKTGQAYRRAPKALSAAKKVRFAVKHEGAGAALIPLEVAGLGGEIMATKILHNDTKRKNGIPTTGVAKRYRLGQTAIDTAAGTFAGVSAGALLQAGNTVQNRRKVQRAAKKAHKEIRKDIKPPTKGRLVQVGVKEGFQVAKRTPGALESTKNNAVKIKDTVSKSVGMTWRGEISKMDTDKKQVFGWASIVEIDGKPVVDLQGDMMTIDTVEKAAYDYVRTSRKGGNQHQRDGEGPKHVSDMIESFLVTEEKKKQMGLPDSVPTGWWVGFQVNDDETWNEVKQGKKTEFSIHGSGVRKELVVDD